MIRIPAFASASRSVARRIDLVERPGVEHSGGVDETVGPPVGALGVTNRPLHGVEVRDVRLGIDDGLAVELQPCLHVP